MDIPRTHVAFACRHIGPREEDIQEMLSVLGLNSLDEMVERIVPETIRAGRPLRLPEPLSEHEALEAIRRLASQNRIHRSFIGMGYFGCITPPVIQRNVLENPGWYTQYTPYQAEIAQGRLEALLNFQTMVCDLTGMEIANASLLDEGTAAAEAMTLCHAVASRSERNRFFVARNCHPQTIELIKTRAFNVGIEVVVRGLETLDELDNCFGALIQFPATDGQIEDYRLLVERIHAAGALVVVASDLLALTLLTPPGDWGADVVVGSAQRFGVPMGFGGPHAAFFATRDEYKRLLPGRIVGVSKEVDGRPALRLALQTREQHIRRDKATSNICTAQVLLAVMASMYAVYHGPEGLRRIAASIHAKALLLAKGLRRLGYSIRHESFFDTLRVDTESSAAILRAAEAGRMNFRVFKDGSIGLSLDETTRETDLADILKVFAGKEFLDFSLDDLGVGLQMEFDSPLARRGAYLKHPVFNSYRSETEMLRYIQRLQARDLSLTTSMIPLGSCTMKLNATAEMLPITWPEWSQLHPFVSLDQAKGYQALIRDLESMLSEITGLARVSLQPNAGSQGEYSGLLTIRAYMRATGRGSRNVCLIPTSAHGTNPASAVMAGLSVVVIDCDDEGNIDLADLRAKAEKHKDELAALMVTYPSTHGVFEESIREICEIVHGFGGQVYLDGANMNALVGLCRPGDFGVDVIHLNLHKTFCIPHGGGGPGVGPIAVAEHLAPYLPSHFHGNIGSDQTIGLIAAAPWGSAGILPISWMYMRMMGGPGLAKATKVAILNANYIAKRLEGHFPVLYAGRTGFVAHECILDCRQFKKSLGISVLDIAKRLMDYGFHAPTVSWPVVETMMVEPTESESREELDRFCDALISIRNEIREIEAGLADPTNNVLKNAPHSLHRVMADFWDRPYSREKAAFPAPWLRTSKFWPSVGRIDDSYGDRHLFCSCVPIDAYAGVTK